MDATYAALQKAVTDDQNLITSLKAKILALQNDAGINNLRAIDNAVAGKNGWIDSSGTYWEGTDATNQRRVAESQIRAQDLAIGNAQNQLNVATKQLATDTIAVNNYQQSSPTLATEIKNDATLALATVQANKIKFIAGSIGVIIVIILIIVIVKNKRSKKTTQ